MSIVRDSRCGVRQSLPTHFLWTAWLLLLVCCVGHVSANEAEVPAAVPAAIATIDDATMSRALAGKHDAILLVRAYATRLDISAARVVLDRLGASRDIRSSSLAACFCAHPDAWIRQLAVMTVGRLRADSSATLNLVMDKLGDASAMVRQATGDALTRMRDARSWPRLVSMLDSRDQEQITIAHDTLCRQTLENFPAERTAWEPWLQRRLDSERRRLDGYLRTLAEPTADVVNTLNDVATLELLRDQAVDIMMTFSGHADQRISARAQKYLWQWTGTRFGVAANGQALTSGSGAPPLPTPSALPASVTPITQITNASSSPSAAPPSAATVFFDSPLGLVTVIFAAIGVLASLLWVLRFFPGQQEEPGTGYITHTIKGTTVRVIVDEEKAPATKPSTRATIMVPRMSGGKKTAEDSGSRLAPHPVSETAAQQPSVTKPPTRSTLVVPRVAASQTGEGSSGSRLAPQAEKKASADALMRKSADKK